MTKITQADRDAADEWKWFLYDREDYDPEKEMEKNVDGLAGDFALHRIEELNRLLAVAKECISAAEFTKLSHALNSDEEFLDLNNYWYRQGKDDGIQQERGNVVEWLSNLLYDWPDYVAPSDLATAIEAGEHLK